MFVLAPSFDSSFQSTHLYKVRRPFMADLSRMMCRISIHAPIQGATIYQSEVIFHVYHFNPRTYTRCDPCRMPLDSKPASFQSTHLYKVRLIPRPPIPCVYLYFNPRTYTRCDANLASEVARLKRISIHAPIQGATMREEHASERWVISIHAPIQGAT